MKLKHLLSALALTAVSSAASASDVDYTAGVFFVNEDWYGHQNSTVNYLLPDEETDYWHYRVVQAENPGHELGCTNQYGAIWNGRFYFIAKQAKDPGASVTGGRITVCDASTMKIIKQIETIDPSGGQCDGRGFIGIDEHKGYVSTSNGIWVLDLDNLEITGQVKGSANPNAGIGNDRPNDDPTGALYFGQSGSMVEANGRIFAAHQQYGLLVIDPARDEVVNTVAMTMVNDKAGIGSVVKAKDGSLWLSVAGNIKGTGTTVACIVRVDPVTLETEVVWMPDGTYPPSNSWYAWTPDTFCASAVNNCLYWSGGSNSWFSTRRIFRFDIDTRDVTQIIDLDADGEGWKLYGCSMRLHPVTDEIYMTLYREFSIPTYIVRRYTTDGAILREYSMITNYWFPSLQVFPQGNNSVSDVVADIQSGVDGDAVYNLQGQRLTTDWEQLPAGLYIRGGRKLLKR